MSFPRYPKYKPSGVEWIGEVPEHWEVSAIKRYSITITDGAHISPETEGGIYPFVSTKDVFSDSIDFENCLRTSPSTFEYMVKTGCRPLKGDVLFSKDGTIGRTVIVREDRNFVVASSLIIIRPNQTELDASFLDYLCQSNLVTSQVESAVKGAGLPRLSIQNLLKVCGCFPPLPEQTAIAAFLDRETAKIDGLVAEQRKLMDLLKEKRQAVISHAVTKGLNPKAQMKPSGIEWLGDVPAHWDVKPLRSVFKFSKGLTITKENLQDEGVCCVNYGEIHSKYGFRLNPDIHTLRYVAPEYLGSNPDALISDGDFVFADTSEDLEGSGNFTHLRYDQQIFAGYHTIIARPRKGICSLLLAYQFHSSVFRSQIQRQVKGVKVFSISQGILKSVKCWLPPYDEQTAIVEFLETELAKFETLTAEAQRAIDLLQERRTALISAAVTGQIDVRRATAQDHPKPSSKRS